MISRFGKHRAATVSRGRQSTFKATNHSGRFLRLYHRPFRGTSLALKLSRETGRAEERLNAFLRQGSAKRCLLIRLVCRDRLNGFLRTVIRRFVRISPLALACLAFARTAADDQHSLHGYSAESARVENEWEGKFRAVPSPENMREYMRRLMYSRKIGRAHV